MLAYQRGDSTAFEVVYGRHKNAVFAYLLRSGAQADSVEEIFQEAWTSIIKNIERYEPKAKFKTYLYQVAHNKMIDYWRRRKHEASDGNCAIELTASRDSDHEQKILTGQLMAAISQLPSEQRCALLLRHQGFSQREICDITGSGAETVKSRLRYAQQSLRTLFADTNEASV